MLSGLLSAARPTPDTDEIVRIIQKAHSLDEHPARRHYPIFDRGGESYDHLELRNESIEVPAEVKPHIYYSDVKEVGTQEILKAKPLDLEKPFGTELDVRKSDIPQQPYSSRLRHYTNLTNRCQYETLRMEREIDCDENER